MAQMMALPPRVGYREQLRDIKAQLDRLDTAPDESRMMTAIKLAQDGPLRSSTFFADDPSTAVLAVGICAVGHL